MNAFVPPYVFVFDVESVGLHGEGFQVGWVVLDTAAGKYTEETLAWCAPEAAATNARAQLQDEHSDRSWVAENVSYDNPRLMGLVRLERCHDTPRAVRDSFWHHLTRARMTYGKGMLVAAEVPVPVEANFLRACIEDDYSARAWKGPYPLIDIASVRLARGFDPLKTCPRLPSELPAHNALADARQSARLLFEALRRQGG